MTADRAIRVIAALGALFFLVTGGWAFFGPESFFDEVALFPPYNEHLIHDVGAFSLGIGATLVLALVFVDGLLVALGGASVGGVLHTIAHVIDDDLGGRDTDVPGLALLAVLLIAGAIWRWSLLGQRGGPGRLS